MDTDSTDLKLPAKRDSHGRLLPGHHLGRPKGSTAIELFRRRMDVHRDDVEAALVKAAKGGDVKACELILIRFVPNVKPEGDPEGQRIAIPDLASATTTEDRALAILNAVGEGRLTITEFQQLFAALASLASALKVSDLAKDVALLKEHAGLAPNKQLPASVVTKPGEDDLV